MAATTAEQAAALLNDSRCDMCNMPHGLAWYAVLAALLDVANGNTVPDATTLIREANCLLCVIPPGAVPYAMIQAIRGISGGTGGGSTLCGAGAPVAAPSGTCALYIDTNDGTLYEFYGGAWH